MKKKIQTLSGFKEGSFRITLTIRERVSGIGNGKDKYINGSNVTETFLQSGQITRDLNCP